MQVLRVAGLPDDALGAAARFHTALAGEAAALLAQGGGPLTLVFPPADHTHRGWREAAVQMLARAHAPARVNAVATADEAALAAALRYLAAAPGLTGQYLPLDGAGAQSMLPPRA